MTCVLPRGARRWRPEADDTRGFDLDFDLGFWVWRSRCLPVLSLVEPFLTSPPRVFLDGG